MGGSRCQRIRQTWTSSLSTNASSIHQKWNASPRAQLNTSRGPWKSKRTRKIPAELGRAKERRKKKNRKGNGMGREERSPPPGKALTGGAQLARKESLILCGKRTRHQSEATGQRRPAHRYRPQPCPPSLRGCPPLQTRAGSWKAESGEQTQAELCCGR